MPSVWIEKRRSSYRVVWRQGQHRYSQNCGTNRDYAFIIRDKKERELYASNLGIEVVVERTFKDFSKEYIEWAKHHKAISTVRDFDIPAISSFIKEYGNRLIKSIKLRDVEEWKSELLKSLKPVTVAMRFTALKAVFSRAKMLGYLSHNPCSGLKKPKQDPVWRVLTDDEISIIVSHPHPSLRRTATFALYTGMRLGEILSLDWRNVRDGMIVFDGQQSAMRKNRRGLRIPISRRVSEMMGKSKSYGKIFPYRKHAVQEALQRLTKRHNLGRIRFHDLRHTFASRYLEAGGHLTDLIETGLWSHLASIAKYAHISGRFLKNNFQALDFAPKVPPNKVKKSKSSSRN